MKHDFLETIIDEEIKKAAGVKAARISISELAAIASEKLGVVVHRETVRRILQRRGIFADGKKHRTWVWRHNPNKGE